MNFDYTLYSISEIAELTNLSRKQVGELIESGRLSFILIGRRKFVPAAALKEFLSSNTIRLEPKKSVSNDVDLLEMRKQKRKKAGFNSGQYFEQLREKNNGLSI